MEILDTLHLMSITIAINLIVGGVNIAVSLGLIWCARTNIKASKLNMETSRLLSERMK